MDLRALKNEGWTNTEIARELGCHPATVAKWLKVDGPPGRAAAAGERPVMTAVWRSRVEVVLGRHLRLLATSVHNKPRAEGFGGSYPTVVRAVREIRVPRFRAAAAASVPIVTGPGEEAQFDFCNLDAVAAGWGCDRPLRCFGAILCWSRRRMWWFTTSEDQNHTFEGLARAFECFGGVPASARTDRMGALGSSQGRRFKLHGAAVAAELAARATVDSGPVAADTAARVALGATLAACTRTDTVLAHHDPGASAAVTVACRVPGPRTHHRVCVTGYAQARPATTGHVQAPCPAP